jgi:hypothetical protein
MRGAYVEMMGSFEEIKYFVSIEIIYIDYLY